MSDSRVKIEVHLIQNFAPSNLNRDDTGQPKSAYFGGFRRARVSSQCEKHAAREWWRKNGSITVGERTKLLKKELAPKLQAAGRTDEQIDTALNTFLAQFYSKMDGDKTAVLLFVSRDELNTAKKITDQHWDRLSNGQQLDTAEARTAASELNKAQLSADIALFGRMLAEQYGRLLPSCPSHFHPQSGYGDGFLHGGG